MENSFSKSTQSGKRRVGFAFILAVALGLCVTTEIRAQVIVAPNVLATNDGNSSITASGSGAFHSMLILDASQFGALSGPSFLTQIARRPDRIAGPSGPLAMTYRIYASTASRSVAGMSTTFSQNIGTNNTLVFDGTITYTTANLPGPGNTRQFDIVTGFTTAFLYDPAAGNLLLDFQYSSFNGSSLQWDAVTGNPTSSALFAGGSPTAPTGSFGASPLYQFTFELPPLVTIRALCRNGFPDYVFGFGMWPPVARSGNWVDTARRCPRWHSLSRQAAGLNAPAQRGIRPASAIEVSRAGFGCGALERLGEHGLLGGGGLHGSRFIAHTCAI